MKQRVFCSSRHSAHNFPHFIKRALLTPQHRKKSAFPELNWITISRAETVLQAVTGNGEGKSDKKTCHLSHSFFKTPDNMNESLETNESRPV